MRWVLGLVLAVAGTYGLRAGSIRVASRVVVSPSLEDVLRCAALALMAALSVASLPAETGGTWSASTVAGLSVAVVSAQRWSNLAVSMTLATAAYWLTGSVT